MLREGLTVNEIVKLDASRPSREQLQEAYELAKTVWDLALWEKMEERQVLTVHFADGREGVVSVMGEMGTHRAIAVYPSFAAYVRIRSADDGDEQSMLDVFFSTNHLQLAFEPAANLNDGEMRDIRASGVKFKRGMNPSFVSYVAGFADDRMGAAELTRYVAFLKAFLAFCDRHGTDAVSVNDGPNKLLTTWTEDASGNWTKGENDYSPMFPVGVTLDETLVEKVAALPVCDKEMCLEVAAFPLPTGRAPNGRGKMSRCVLAVEGATRFAMGFELVETPDDRELDWTPIVEFALKTMIKFEYRPTHLAAFGCGLHGVLKALTNTRFRGTEFLPNCPCDSAREVFGLIRARLGVSWPSIG